MATRALTVQTRHQGQNKTSASQVVDWNASRGGAGRDLEYIKSLRSGVAGERRVVRIAAFINGDSQVKATQRPFGLINILIMQLFSEYLF